MYKKDLSIIVIQRFWQGFAGLITVIAITLFLSRDQQGWYYTFLSLAALYSFFEMGLSNVLIQRFAHMFVDLKWSQNGKIEGEKAEEFFCFLFHSFKTYFFLMGAFLLVSFSIGQFIFTHKSNSNLLFHSYWFLPWLFLVITTASNTLTFPFLAAIEGSGNILEAYKIRLIQGVLGSVATWLALFKGGWLWAASMLPLISAIIIFIWLKIYHKNLFKLTFEFKHKSYDWVKDVWPFQWRVGLNWMSFFLMSQLATPIIFIFKTPVLAGQMGVTLAIAHMLSIVAQSWMVRHIPKMSQAVAKKNWNLLDKLFFNDFKISLFILLCEIFTIIIICSFFVPEYFLERILPLPNLMGLLGFIFFYHINYAFSVQLRSFHKEPLVWITLLGSTLILIGSIIFVRIYSVDGVIWTMFLVQALFVFPSSLLLWHFFNKKWRKINGT